MKITDRTSETVIKVVVLEVRCDRCGQNFKLPRSSGVKGVEFALDFGYGSRFDLETWDFDLCDDCAEWLKGELSYEG